MFHNLILRFAKDFMVAATLDFPKDPPSTIPSIHSADGGSRRWETLQGLLHHLRGSLKEHQLRASEFYHSLYNYLKRISKFY